jgi:hypothetical protein
MLYPIELCVQLLTANYLRQERLGRFDRLILRLDTGCVKSSKSEPKSDWQITQYSNLIRYVPSGKFFA